jgi:hypothetical protein
MGKGDVLDFLPFGQIEAAKKVSFASIVGLFCLCSRSLLPLQWVSFASIVGLFCLYSRSLLPL